ncbi:HNH endonuclease [Peribacillus frigoritolerans]|uniref:HNH endonuclease n=1 Tax=Peribacillus frigoritolerans TaxID=450367 RepID=UPI0039A3C33E
MEEFQLVEDIDEVKKNMIQFNNDIKENEEMRRRFLSHFRQWYYIREIDTFAPSKFIGYKKMNATRYNNKDGTGADGRKTEVELRRWFVKKEVPLLHRELQGRFGEYGRIKESSEIHILKSEESYFKHLLDEREELSDGTEDNEKLNNTLIIIPALEPVERSREYNLYEDPIRDRVVYESLFHGRTRRWLDENIIGLKPDESRGYQTMGILHFIGLKDKHKGIFKGLSIYKAVQLLEQQDSDFSLVIQSLQRFNNMIEKSQKLKEVIIDDIDSEQAEEESYHTDGAVKEYYGKRYERNPENRKMAIEIHGLNCVACGFNFELVYGERGKDFIEVHHVKPLSTIGEEVVIDPEKDLVPVCSNCHRMIHRRKDEVLTVEELRQIIYRIREVLSY